MSTLKDDFKSGSFKPVYLLYGEERYMVRYYAELFAERLFEGADAVMNSCVFEGAEHGADDIIDAAETLPFMCGKRLVYVKNSMLFSPERKEGGEADGEGNGEGEGNEAPVKESRAAAARKADAEALAAYLPNIPESAVLVFTEKSVDKRSRLYKRVAELGCAEECKIPEEKDLMRWIGNICKKKGKSVSPETARLLISTVQHGMDSIYAELDKLDAYTGERTRITDDDIRAICTPTPEARVFDMVGAMCEGDTKKALVSYRQMLALRESPYMVLAMLARQFRLILQCKAYADEGMTLAQIKDAAKLKLDFMAREFLRHGRQFSAKRLFEALDDCRDTDARVKTGLLDAETGVELLIVRYSGREVS
jgi:DNA polymerase-3 subunit delta